VGHRPRFVVAAEGNSQGMLLLTEMEGLRGLLRGRTFLETIGRSIVVGDEPGRSLSPTTLNLKQSLHQLRKVFHTLFYYVLRLRGTSSFFGNAGFFNSSLERTEWVGRRVFQSGVFGLT
jgi:hypothetical protein